MIKDVFISLVSYYFFNISEYLLHELSHSIKYGGYMYEWHHKHHVIEYPPNRLVSKGYSSSPYYENFYSYFILLWIFTIYQFMNPYYFKLLSCEVVSYGFIVDQLHQQYHLEKSILEGFKWFQKKKANHLLHHKQMHLNYNIMDNTSDKIFNTYKES
jgi:hypothetical protein